MPFHLAQCNIVKLKAPLDSPVVAGFVAALDPINALADAAPGFVWRLKTEDGDATSIRVFDDDQILLNMSVWESIEALHGLRLSKRSQRRTAPTPTVGGPFDGVQSAMWWVRAGTIPEPSEAVARLEYLARVGPSAVRLHVPIVGSTRTRQERISLADLRRRNRPSMRA